MPDAVLDGRSAAALHAGHRDSFDHDHDHVLADLVERYAAVLDAVEAAEGWATSVRASRPPFTIMGSLGGVEAGLRQMRRSRPLETCEVDVGDDAAVVALAEPRPRDPDVTEELPRYRNLDPRWHRWSDVVDACRSLALDLSGVT